MSEKDKQKQDKTKEKYTPNASLGSAVISLVNSTLGAGMLGIPLAYAKAGVFPAIVMHIVMALMSFFSFHFLIEVADALQQYSLGELSETLFGVIGVVVIEFCNAIYGFGSLWAYMILITDFLTSMLRGLGIPSEHPCVQNWFIAILVAFFVLQPLSWMRKLDSLRFTSFFGTISMAICVAVVIFRFFSPFDKDFHPDPPLFARPTPAMIQTFSTLTFAFGCQQNIPIIQGEIKKRSRKTMYIVSVFSISTVGIFYMIAGLFGYFSFTTLFYTDPHAGNILEMFDDKDIGAVVARICSLITVLFCFPMNSLPTRLAIYNIVVGMKHHFSRKGYTPLKEANKSFARPELVNVKGQEVKLDVKNYSGESQTLKENEGMDEESPESEDSTETLPLRRSFISSTVSMENMSEASDPVPSKKVLCTTLSVIVSCAVGSTLVLIVMVLSIFLNKVNFVFDIVGSTAGVAIAFIVPPVLYLRLKKNPRRYIKRHRFTDPRFPEMGEENKKRLEELFEESKNSGKTGKFHITPGRVMAYVTIAFGLICGLFSLSMAIIFDTDISKHVNW